MHLATEKGTPDLANSAPHRFYFTRTTETVCLQSIVVVNDEAALKDDCIEILSVRSIGGCFPIFSLHSTAQAGC
jgi:hypothetical protein